MIFMTTTPEAREAVEAAEGRRVPEPVGPVGPVEGRRAPLGDGAADRCRGGRALRLPGPPSAGYREAAVGELKLG
ncbi:hypothetical protein DUI70_2899 [Streptomyces albus]|nr:hypothetical protein DUI70_2899 [Streptomyces albus]